MKAFTWWFVIVMRVWSMACAMAGFVAVLWANDYTHATYLLVMATWAWVVGSSLEDHSH